MAHIFCVANQKGGVGKTTTTVNLAAGLAQLGQRVLVVDLDPQGNATMGSGIDKRSLDSSVYDVLLQSVSLAEACKRSQRGGYDIVGANRELAGAEVELVQLPHRDQRLKQALDGAAGRHDFVLIDCPPSLSLLTLNGLCSAHGVVVPMQCEYFALEGLSDLVNTIKQVHANLNPALRVIGLLRVMFDARITLQQQVSDQLRSHFGDKVFDTVIPRNVRLAEAPSYGLPGVVFDPSSKGAQAYVDFAGELMSRVATLAAVDSPPHADGPLAPEFDATLLSRVEDAGLNASAPAQQRWVDGWLLRHSPGKAKRARCINALAVGRLPLADKLQHCAAVFRNAGLPMVVRITPFTQPPELDAQLAALGLSKIDDTRVMVLESLDALRGVAGAAAPLSDGWHLEETPADRYAQTIGALRGSSPIERAAHAQRLGASPVPCRGVVLRTPDGQAAACGVLAREADLAGLYDVFTAPLHRGRGFATWVCTRLLTEARTAGAHSAYLQVESDNHAARAVYRRLGFADGYGYHYRIGQPAG